MSRLLVLLVVLVCTGCWWERGEGAHIHLIEKTTELSGSSVLPRSRINLVFDQSLTSADVNTLINAANEWEGLGCGRFEFLYSMQPVPGTRLVRVSRKPSPPPNKPGSLAWTGLDAMEIYEDVLRNVTARHELGHVLLLTYPNTADIFHDLSGGSEVMAPGNSEDAELNSSDVEALHRTWPCK